jgi:hypothetical protein
MGAGFEGTALKCKRCWRGASAGRGARTVASDAGVGQALERESLDACVSIALALGAYSGSLSTMAHCQCASHPQ